MDRRELITGGVAIGMLASSRRGLANDARAASVSRYAPCFDRLDRYVEQYLHDMNAPGLTLCLADADGVQRVSAYGFEDLALKVPLKADRLVHIGSISKSFLGLCLMQLHEAGSLDLHRPIQEYLPWVRYETTGRPISAHDLLTHSAALPDGPVFPADPAFRYRPTAPPGTFFHYCNMGYAALGHLLAQLDQRPLRDSLRARILKPLGMMATDPEISLDAYERTAASYQGTYNDRPFPRQGSLTRSPPIALIYASGCINSTAADMGRYVTMLINRGANLTHPIVSRAAFDLFAHPHMPAAEFGSGAAYGYGIAVDQLLGHTRLRHTGGMVSFASALQVDLDAGVGAFASVNAMQGYRPNPIAEYAIRLMRACRDGSPLPPIPPPDSALRIPNASQYAGAYLGSGNQTLKVIAEADRLYLLHQEQRVALESAVDSEDTFTVLHPDLAHYALLFTRSGADGKGPVVEAGWGEDWYTAPGYSGPRTFKVPEEWVQYAGHYRNEDPWIGSVRIVIRRGKLWMNGLTPLEPAADGRFYLRETPDSPEWVSFSDIVNRRAMQMRMSGYALTRA
jgi:CubicO group peptidase (beta-lactamase class C family)